MKTVLTIGAREILRLSEIVRDPQLLAQLESAKGTWSTSNDVVAFSTPNVGRAVVEIRAARVGHAVVSFASNNPRIKGRPSVEVEVVSKKTDEEFYKEIDGVNAQLERERAAGEAAQAEAEAKQKAEEEAARLEAEAKAESERLAAEAKQKEEEALLADEAEHQSEPPASDVVH